MAELMIILGGGHTRQSGAHLRSQEFTAKYLFKRRLTTLFGYSHFLAGRFIERSSPTKDIDFLYLPLQFTF